MALTWKYCMSSRSKPSESFTKVFLLNEAWSSIFSCIWESPLSRWAYRFQSSCSVRHLTDTRSRSFSPGSLLWLDALEDGHCSTRALDRGTAYRVPWSYHSWFMKEGRLTFEYTLPQSLQYTKEPVFSLSLSLCVGNSLGLFIFSPRLSSMTFPVAVCKRRNQFSRAALCC